MENIAGFGGDKMPKKSLWRLEGARFKVGLNECEYRL